MSPTRAVLKDKNTFSIFIKQKEIEFKRVGHHTPPKSEPSVKTEATFLNTGCIKLLMCAKRLNR